MWKAWYFVGRLVLSKSHYYISTCLQTKTTMGEAMRAAMFSLAEANFAAGDFRFAIVPFYGTAGFSICLNAVDNSYCFKECKTPLIA